MGGRIWAELKRHSPFTALGALTGVAIMVALVAADVPREVSHEIFWILHPLHVLLSALVTASMYRLRGSGNWLSTIVIGYLGSVGIATLSDSIIPYLGEWMLDLPNRGIHLGFIERWWLVNPLAILGIVLSFVRPTTRVPHAGHVLLSTWASLFHMALALGTEVSVATYLVVGLFLFLAVWLPCCASDIVFPLLFVKDGSSSEACH